MSMLWIAYGYGLQCMSWMVLSWLLIKCCCFGFRAVLVSGHVASLTIRGRGDAPDCDIICVALLRFGTRGRLGPLCDIIWGSSVVF